MRIFVDEKSTGWSSRIAHKVIVISKLDLNITDC